MSEAKVKTWIKAGYKILGSKGMEGIKAERIARPLQISKSGLYYYFGSMNGYVERLMQHHFNLAQGIGKEVRSCENIDPDFLHLIVKHRLFFLVESQLLVKNKHAYANANKDFVEAGKIISVEFLPLWKKVNELSGDSTVAEAYLNILRDFFYARINSENINYEFLHQMASETKTVMTKVVEEKYFSPGKH